MQKQLPRHLSQQTLKPPKQSPKHLLKQHLTVLQSLYQPCIPNPTPIHTHNLYMRVLQTMQQILICYMGCSNNIRAYVDFMDVIGNNFVLGLKINNDPMAAGFVYLAAKYIMEGSAGLGKHIVHLKALQDHHDINTHAQLRLAYSILRPLLLFTPNSPKCEQLIENAISCLCKITQPIHATNKQKCQLNPQNNFYHQCLRVLKQSPHPKSHTLSKQVLSSYYRYLHSHHRNPNLDICRLLLQILQQQPHPDNWLTSIPSSSSTKSKHLQKSNAKRSKDNDLLQYLIRKTFQYVGECYGKNGFYVEDEVMRSVVGLCFGDDEGVGGSTLGIIVQVLFTMGKLDIMVDEQYWMHQQVTNKYSSSSSQQQSSSQSNTTNRILKYLTSCLLYTHTLKHHHNTHNKPPSTLPLFHKKLSSQLPTLLLTNQPILLHLCHQLITNLHQIKSQIFSRCNRKHILSMYGQEQWSNVEYVRMWGIVVEIQQCVVGCGRFKHISGNAYDKYQYSNAYIMVIMYMIGYYHNTHNTHKLGQTHEDPQYLTSALHTFNNPNTCQHMHKYWDDLLTLCAYLFQNTTQTTTLTQINNTINKLLKCTNMYSGGQATSNRYVGLCNLLITLQKNKNEKSGQKLQVSNSGYGKGSGGFGATKSRSFGSVGQVRMGVRSQVVVGVCQYFVNTVINIVSDKNQLQNDKMDRSHGYQDVFGYVLALLPIVQSQLSLQDRSKVIKSRNTIVHKCPPRVLNRCRYIYHKTTAILLQSHTPESPPTIPQSYIHNYCHLYKFPTHDEHHHQPRTHRQSINKIKAQLKLKQNQRDKIMGEYDKILYIDFMQWVMNVCERKQYGQLREAIGECLEVVGVGKLEDYFVAVVEGLQECSDWDSLQYDILQLSAQCTTKLLYLQQCQQTKKYPHCSPQPEPSTSCSSSSPSQPIRINLQFELQQSSMHTSHICPILTNFSNTCTSFLQHCPTPTTYTNVFHSLNWPSVRQRAHDYYRLQTCLTNIINMAYRVGYSEGDQMFRVLLVVKVVVGYLGGCGVFGLYLIYAQMVLFGYIQPSQHKMQEIMAAINKWQILNKDKHNQTSTTCSQQSKPNNSPQSITIPLIKLYLNLQSPHPHSFLQQSHILKLILTLQSLLHMHPHKSLLRSISGYIFVQRSLNQQALIKYQGSLLPYTSAIVLAGNSGNGWKGLIEGVSAQMEHYVLGEILMRILLCVLMNGQGSELRSVLKLSTIYFLRSINTRGTLLTLQCYQSRTKPQHSPTPDHPRRSHLQPPPHPTAEQQPGIQDMLSISDSLSTILISLFGQSVFKKNVYDRFCKIVIGGGGNKRRRTSMGYRVGVEMLGKMLEEGLGDCGVVGAEIALILGNYACTVLQSYKLYCPYFTYLTILFKNSQPQPLQQPHPLQHLNLPSQHLQDKQLNTNLNKLLYQLYTTTFKKILQQDTQNQQLLPLSQLQKFHALFIKVAGYSYLHACVLQSLYILWEGCDVGVQVRIKGEMLLEVVSAMFDYNYRYKKYVETVEPININISDVHNLPSILQSLQTSNTSYKSHLTSKPPSLLSPTYPLTILYPLGPYLLTISLYSQLLIHKQVRSQFEEHINIVDNLIANNSKLLNDKNVDPKDWWKSRDRVDRAIGKVCNQAGIWMWDIQSRTGMGKREMGMEKGERKLWKFVELCFRNSITDLKKIKQYMKSSNVSIDNSSLPIQQIQYKIISAPMISQPQNLLLMVHPSYLTFPYQSLSLLNNRGVYRIISPSYLYQHSNSHTLASPACLNIRYLKYLINTNNDLLQTQKNFYRMKNNYVGWSGIIGRKPSIKQYLQLLEKDNVFLFMGHGTGSAHFKEREFYCTPIHSFIMLFGCNSVALTLGAATGETCGVALSHLINGAKGVLGCLWEVTDRDTDRLTQTVFKSVSHIPQNMSRILTNSKKKCKHQYLNGGALVIFGLPVTIYHD